MPKFMGIDLLDSLERIMKKNTLSYQGISHMTGKILKMRRQERMRCLSGSGHISGCPDVAVPGA